MILLIDNYDSFTHNLYQLIAKYHSDIKVVRNDKISIKEVEKLRADAIIFSPGPGRPEEAGICIELIRQMAPSTPMLGICLGHQAIGAAFGGQVILAPEIRHGKRSPIFHRRKGLFKNVPLPFSAGRYHSLVIAKQNFPASLLIEAETSNGTIMAVRHAKYPCFGLQFHPESILTPDGEKLISNFIEQEVISCLKK